MTLDFARTFLVPIATASKIKSTSFCHRKKSRHVIRDLLIKCERGGTQSTIAANNFSMEGSRLGVNSIYDSTSNTTDSDTTRTCCDEDESTLSRQSVPEQRMQPSSSLASSAKSSKGGRRPGYKTKTRTGVPKPTAACELRHTKIKRIRPVPTVAPVMQPAPRSLRTKSAKQAVHGKEKLNGKYQLTAGDSTSVRGSSKEQASKKSVLKTTVRNSCTAVTRKYGAKVECAPRLKRSSKTTRGIVAKVSQTKVPRPSPEKLLVHGERIMMENNSTNASETKGFFLEVKMRDGTEKECDAEIIGTFLTRESRLQFCDASPGPPPELERPPINTEQLESPDEKNTPTDRPQVAQEQTQIHIEEPRESPEKPQVLIEKQVHAQIENPLESPEKPQGFIKSQLPGDLHSASTSSSRVKASLTKTAPVIISFPPHVAATDRESGIEEVKAALPTVPIYPSKLPAPTDRGVKHIKIKRRPDPVPSTTTKVAVKKAASGNKITAEKFISHKPRKGQNVGAVKKATPVENLRAVSSKKTWSDPNCRRPRSCAHNPPPTTLATKRDAPHVRDISVSLTRTLKSRSDVKTAKSGGSIKTKSGGERDKNANASHGVISRKANRRRGGDVRHRRDVFAGDEEDVNVNADDVEEGASRNSKRPSKKDSQGIDILNLESHKPQSESKDVESDPQAPTPLPPPDEPETTKTEEAEDESGAGEKVEPAPIVKARVGSIGGQSKHVNIQEAAKASPRVVRKKRKKTKVKKSRTEEFKEPETARCPLFQGWDFGTTLEKHTMDHVPMETDITPLLLGRTTRTLWMKAGSGFKTDLLAPLQYPSAIHTEKTDVQKYLAKHGISEHFQRITNTVTDEPMSDDPLQTMINQGNVLSRQAVYQREAERLLAKVMNKPFTNPISFPSVLKTEALQQAELAESKPSAEQSVDDESEVPTGEQTGEQAASTVDESATVTGKTSDSTNITNETTEE